MDVYDAATLGDLDAVGFALRRKTTWTLGYRYEVTPITADGAYGEATLTAKPTGAGFRASFDESKRSAPWLTIVGRPEQKKAGVARVADRDGVEIATIQAADRSATPKELLHVASRTGSLLFTIGFFDDAKPGERVVRAGNAEIGRFWQIDQACSALRFDEGTHDARIALSALLCLDRYHSVSSVGEDEVGNIVWS